ncbi:hypothetical protein JCM8202_006114 [Rhodotorula sphaerocarpa]
MPRAQSTLTLTDDSPAPRIAPRRRTLPAAIPVSPTGSSTADGNIVVDPLPSSIPAGAAESHALYGSPRVFNPAPQLSSPVSLFGSPPGMTRSMSAHSVFGSLQQQALESSPLARSVSSDVGSRSLKGSTRRKRVAPNGDAIRHSPYASPSISPLRPPGDIYGSGKEADNVWPPDVDDAFFRALHLLPRLGRKKLLINGKPCGRNELISDYIFRTTGKTRTRKQVSSHIQVLKNLYREDKQFLWLISEPTIESDVFDGDNARIFFGNDSPPAHLAGPSAATAPAFQQDPAFPLSTQMWRSDSAPTYNQPFMLHPSHGISDPTIELSQAFQESSLDIPTYARFDPWASISSQASVPMQPSASLPVYLAPPDSNDIEMPFPLADAAAMDEARFLEAFFRVPSPAIPAPAVPHPLPEQPLLRPPDTLDAEVPAMSTTSSSTGSTASTAPTEGSAFSASTPKASTLLGDSPPPAGMPDKAKAHREQELFSQLLGAKTRYTGFY